jgi:arginyl-tRNA synthetase
VDVTAFADEARRTVVRLQAGSGEEIALWKRIVDETRRHYQPVYERLNVALEMQHERGESFYNPMLPQVVADLKAKGLAVESEGATAVFIDGPDKPPVIVEKTGGGYLYATTDLAAIIQRTEEFCPDRIWYIVVSRQSLHFKQVFRCAGKAGLVPDTKLEHLGFGTMNGADGKPYKTRDGGVMPLSELYSSVCEAALERVSASGYGNQADKTETAEKIAAAAIKFGDLVNHRLKDYVFDPGKFLAAEGKTGAFLLYTVARINSILRRYNGEASAPGSLRCASDTERMLLMKLAMSGQAFVAAFTMIS